MEYAYLAYIVFQLTARQAMAGTLERVAGYSLARLQGSTIDALTYLQNTVCILLYRSYLRPTRASKQPLKRYQTANKQGKEEADTV